jgi:hypothetical protein
VLPFLRAAQVDFPGEREVKISVPPGPGLERLQESSVQQSLREALARHFPQEVELTVRPLAPVGGPEGRITEEKVRRGRLQALVDKEPTLGEAVQELDLELLD